MQKNCNEWLILGITEKGKTFRPSDWADRLCGAFAYYSQHGRWTYSDHAYPILHEGLVSVRVHSSLQAFNPVGYEFVMNFARSNQLKLVSLADETVSSIEAAQAQDIALSVKEFTFALLVHQWKTNLFRTHLKNKIQRLS